MTSPDQELLALRAENARLVELLEAHGIEWRTRPEQARPPDGAQATARLATGEKIELFRRLFRGRPDVYPVRWEGRTSGKSGYSPACANEWRPGICEKPRIKCSDCSNRLFIPLSDPVIYRHLSGEHTIGVYPLLQDDTCWFLAVDFDEESWREDACAFAQSCRELGVPVALEISRSGQGAHAWMFFADRIPARDARRLGASIISHTCAHTRQLRLASYDRMFPNQDAMPKGGFGNLIALPLQKQARERGYSVFVDESLHPYPDQWGFLSSIEPMSPDEIEPAILRAMGSAHPLDVTFIQDEGLATPWKRNAAGASKLAGDMPASLTLTLADQIYVEKASLPQSLANRMIRLAAFQNPEFYRAQAMRMSVWDKPRIIGCAENFPRHIALPRGCLSSITELLADNGISCDLVDERQHGSALDTHFAGTLRADQRDAVSESIRHDTGVLCAPTAFGKTVVAAAVISRRKVNTLVLVHRTELLRQWQERLQTFLGAGKDVIGVIGGGKSKPTGNIDIAVMQSLFRQGEVDSVVECYGQVIVDECHHVGAASFNAILKRVKAKFVLGLTATPIRRDGLQPIIFMQCGPLRHMAARPDNAPVDLEVMPRFRTAQVDLPEGAGIQNVFRHLASDPSRTQAIADEALSYFEQGRKVLVLTERTDHLEAIRTAIDSTGHSLFVLHGRMSARQRAALLADLNTLPANKPRILLATGRLVGEGFDHPPLDTLVLAMPVSWKGTLQQYAGRLHRDAIDKTHVRICDFVDSGHPALVRMWEKRKRGYRSMGYRIADQGLA